MDLDLQGCAGKESKQARASRASLTRSPQPRDQPLIRQPRRPPIRALAAAVVLLAACSTDNAAESTTGDNGGTTSDSAPSPPAAFTDATTIEGAAFDDAALAGRDAVAWFWAPWCVICRSEGPDIADVAARYGDRVILFGVTGHGEVADMADFVTETGTGGITHIADPNGSIWNAYGVYSQPAFAFIDDDGTVDVFVGSLGDDALVKRIDNLIAN